MKQLYKILSMLLIFMLTFTFLSPLAHSEAMEAEYGAKDEVIYGTLSEEGKSDAAYVVNVFEVSKAGVIEDYGNYTSIKNLTNLTEIEQNTDEVEFEAEEGKFYYQGDLANPQLPWEFKVTYYLDGKEITPEKLLGKSGKLKIAIETRENKEVDDNFFKHYTLQISVPFDVEKFSNVQAEDATVVNAGKTEQVSFTILPEKEADVSISAQVEDFELDGIDIVAIPFVMTLDDIETDDMVDDMENLSDAIAELHDGVGSLHDGVHGLQLGTENLQEGSAQFQAGLGEVNNASPSLVNGSAQINKALQTMQEELSSLEDIDLSKLEDVTTALTDMEKGLQEIERNLDQLASHYTKAYSQLKQVVSHIPDKQEKHSLTKEEINKMIAAGISEEKINYLLANEQAAQSIKQMFTDKNFIQLFDNLAGALQQSSAGVKEVAKGLGDMKKAFQVASEQLGELDHLAELMTGMQQFTREYDAFHKGLVDYTDGVAELTKAYDSLHSGIKEVTSGTGELSSGTAELHDGTGELRSETNNLPEAMQEEIDAFLETYDHTDFEAKSFVSGKNDNIGLVQFILKTGEIKHPEVDEEEEDVEEKKGFWEMLKRLFKF